MQKPEEDAGKISNLHGGESKGVGEQNMINPKWISVKDRLPEDNGKYLVVVYGDKIEGPYVATRFFWNGNFEEFQYFPQRYISHWMPLPELPKEET